MRTPLPTASVLLLALAACNGAKPAPAPPVPGPRAALLEAAGACAVEKYDEALATAKELEIRSAAWATQRTEAARDAARDAWSDAMSAWQKAELYRMGPTARPNDPGAESLRDEIYAWPLLSRCKIEEQIVSKAYESPTFTNSLISARTLTAAEYLLFYEGADNGCGGFSTINANGTWAALSEAELEKRKVDYLVAVTEDVVVKAQRLVDAWSPSGGNFLKEFAKAGQTSGTYRTEMEALNALSHALFYVEIEVKDYKLGRPLGIQLCPDGEGNCPFESPWALRSTQNVVDNLDAAHGLFLGCDANNDGVAFDDWLEAAGHGALGEEMKQALENAQAAAANIDKPLGLAATESEADIEALYASIKSFTDLLKTEFVSVLNLELPQTAEGDND